MLCDKVSERVSGFIRKLPFLEITPSAKLWYLDGKDDITKKMRLKWDELQIAKEITKFNALRDIVCLKSFTKNRMNQSSWDVLTATRMWPERMNGMKFIGELSIRGARLPRKTEIIITISSCLVNRCCDTKSGHLLKYAYMRQRLLLL